MLNCRTTAHRVLMRFSSTRTMSSATPDAKLFFVRPGATDSTSSEGQKLWAVARTGSSTKALDTRVMFSENSITSLVSLGEQSAWSKKTDAAKREAIRKAAGKGVGKVKDLALSADVRMVEVDAGGEVDAHAAAVGAKLGLHKFTLKTKKDANPGKGACCVLWIAYTSDSLSSSSDITIMPSAATDFDAWKRGEVYASSQILAREVCEKHRLTFSNDSMSTERPPAHGATG